MALLGKALAAGGAVRRALMRRPLRGGGGHGHGEEGGGSWKDWWAPGDSDATGRLFNETPLPPGQKRKWEDWELPFYVTSVLTVIILGVGLNAAPDTRLDHWARRKAIERLKQEGLLEE